MTKGKGLADASIVDFHRQFNDKKFKDIYNAAHADLKAAGTEADFLKLLEEVHQKLGKHVKSTEAGWGMNTFNMKTSVAITQNSDFEQGKAVEQFTYVVSAGACTLQSYYINPQGMMTK